MKLHVYHYETSTSDVAYDEDEYQVKSVDIDLTDHKSISFIDTSGNPVYFEFSHPIYIELTQ